jgi:probable HAF family extracellular repeat protein
MHDLGALGSGTSYGELVDNRDWVVGHSLTTDGSDHSVLFHDGDIVDYGPVGSYAGDDLKIKDKKTNGDGEAIGQFWTDDGEYHACVYIDGVLHDLGTLPGGDESECFDINDRSQIVGYDFHTQTAILWNNYLPQDLNELITPESDWQLMVATGINENGQIVGWGRYNNHTRAYLANPIPEPATALAFGAGLIGLLLLQRRRGP